MKAEIGNSLWTLLHEFAAAYPTAPTKEDTLKARVFFDTFEILIRTFADSCTCYSEWQKIVSYVRPPINDGDALRTWAFAAHDWVNLTLGRPVFNPSSEGHELLAKHPSRVIPSDVKRQAIKLTATGKCGSCGKA